MSGRENKGFFRGGGHWLSEHPNKGLPLIQLFNHLPELELSSNFGRQCFLERLSGVRVIAYICIPTWRERSWGADSMAWVLVDSFHFRVTSPETTETLKACHVEIVPILHLLCEQRLSSGLRKRGLVSSLFSTQEPPRGLAATPRQTATFKPEPCPLGHSTLVGHTPEPRCSSSNFFPELNGPLDFPCWEERQQRQIQDGEWQPQGLQSESSACTAWV